MITTFCTVVLSVIQGVALNTRVLPFSKGRALQRRLYRLHQTSTIAAYITAFSALMDQLTTYEPNPDMLHYTTHFIDGLKPFVRLIVAVQ
jgi:hypothetical protein